MSSLDVSPSKRRGLSPSQRKRILDGVVISFFVIYTLATLFPFYALFIRTFVGTTEATELHLWIPPTEEVSLKAGIGNLAVFYNLDLDKVKTDLGIPSTDYIPARTTLAQVAEKYDIAPERINTYFGRFYTYNGWIVLFSEGKLLPALVRTALITLASLVGVHVLSICTGFGLAGLGRKYKMVIYSLYLINPLIPPMLVLLPQFLIMQSILTRLPESARSIGQMLAIVLIYIKGGALPVMVYTSSISAIPRELEESAEIDGANRLQYLIYVVLPLLKVPMATVTVIMLPWWWNDFLQPYVYLSPNNTTLLPLIQQYTGQYTTNYQVSFTGIFVSIIPLLVIYILFRRWFIRGAMSGAIKG